VTFLLCAGSRDENHLKYCSSVCCLSTLKQTMYLMEQDSDIKSYVFYKDMRTPGIYEKFYEAAQENEKLFLTKGEIASITEGDDGNLVVEVDNTLLGEKVEVHADMVVLATGMVSNAIDPEMKEQEAGAEEEEKKEEAPAEDISEEEAKGILYREGHVLNLQYRQGPELPLNGPLYSGIRPQALYPV